MGEKIVRWARMPPVMLRSPSILPGVWNLSGMGGECRGFQGDDKRFQLQGKKEFILQVKPEKL